MEELLSELNDIKEDSREVRVMFYGDNVEEKIGYAVRDSNTILKGWDNC